MNLVLQDNLASKDIEWGKLYASDHYIFDDIEFRTEVVATDED